jgi:mannose-6-phosphate isomerase-like protein (cupin superfamily)
MSDRVITADRGPVVLAPGQGRAYPMGRLSAVFKADGAETGQRYSISEWWLDPHTKGPGPHAHPEDDAFYVLAGVLHVLVDTEWVEAAAGSFVLIPGNVTHDFENRSSERAGMLDVSVPGNFEEKMPGIAKWFVERAPADSQT